MANTYTQLHIQLVFAVKFRLALIQKEWKERLHQYITGIIQKKEGKEKSHKLLQINSPDNYRDGHTNLPAGRQVHFIIGSKCKNRKYYLG